MRGEGGGAVLLKRFSREDECAVLLVGSSVSSDAAALPPGFPDCQAQQRAIRDALGSAGLSAEVVSYTEAHGVGTTVGDATELEAFAGTFGMRGSDRMPLTLSSFKGNAGHSFLTSGVLALIKVNQYKPSRSLCSVFCRLHAGWYCTKCLLLLVCSTQMRHLDNSQRT